MKIYRTQLYINLLIIFFLNTLQQTTLKAQDDFGSKDYIIFGIYCGECVGRCATIYKIDSKHIYVDKSDRIFENVYDDPKLYKFKGDTLEEKFNIIHDSVVNILYEVPYKIWDKPDVIGFPDQFDQCGLFVRLYINGKLKTLLVDTDMFYDKHERALVWKDDENVKPMEIQEFILKLKECRKIIRKRNKIRRKRNG